ncbi:hypothetical protein [Mycolicibacter kumamotonensis]|jgi:hypothetical protein|uniref:Uncharacterized protein n=1 Tax=Mycolicibacter kumamotonensis TaxID=354243 RepID=A0A1B8SB25_9MYCO|nr:hypothetical protein [Mycolicibacter kumamotonensis]NDJ91395.1 hypothetical protein [Mycolicibacter kumamotonensis]OBY29930.1 hypothetical protein ACT18_20365 [Mycolicibacter kumamotonensis]ORA76786.1 hypothetical protein BST28_20370 [Mycolicibacter kumamotonensis]
MRATRISCLAALAAGASLGLAGPANAELADGTYTMTISESNQFQVGQTQTWHVGSCGPDQPPGQAHGFITTVENTSLSGTFTFDDGAYYKYQLKKN